MFFARAANGFAYQSHSGLRSETFGNGSTLLNLSYDYAGVNGKRTGQLTKILNNLNHNKDRGYSYDALGRLVQGTGGPSSSPLWTQTYTYDRYGDFSVFTSEVSTYHLRPFRGYLVSCPTNLCDNARA
jgi:hypothetical protein